MQDYATNKSDYLLQNSSNLPKYATLNTLNEIIIDDSSPSNDQVEKTDINNLTPT